MTTSGIGRALKYFIRQAHLYVLFIIAGSFAMAAYIWVLNVRGASFAEMLKSVPSSAVLIALLFLFTSEMSSFQYWYSIPISFGCLRKNVFWGSTVMDLLVMAETFIFYVITSYLFCSQLLMYELLFMIAMLLIIEGAAKFVGIVAMKWGKIAYIGMIIGVLLISMSIGFVVGYVGMSGPIFAYTSILGEDFVRSGLYILLAVGAFICILGNALSGYILKGYEVKS